MKRNECLCGASELMAKNIGAWTEKVGHPWFRAMKYLKTYLRSTMKETCLNGFALLYVYRDLNINFGHVIDEFSCKNRLLNFK